MALDLLYLLELNYFLTNSTRSPRLKRHTPRAGRCRRWKGSGPNGHGERPRLSASNPSATPGFSFSLQQLPITIYSYCALPFFPDCDVDEWYYCNLCHFALQRFRPVLSTSPEPSEFRLVAFGGVPQPPHMQILNASLLFPPQLHVATFSGASAYLQYSGCDTSFCCVHT